MTSRGGRSLVLVVDWLGRGGIAQTTDAWRRALRLGQHEVAVVSRSGRELLPDRPVAPAAGPKFVTRMRTHRAVALEAVRAIEDLRPDVVVVQNYIVPYLEAAVFDAAHRASAPVVFVVHNAVPHTLASGSRIGLRRLLDAADALVTHSRFVEGGVRALGTDTPTRFIPHPPPHVVLDEPRPPIVPVDPRRTIISFGTLNRRYKNTNLLSHLEHALPDVRFVIAGVGASTERGVAFDRFLDGGELAAVVEAGEISVLPYTRASQSGAVVLSQALGSVPVASAVGGIPEQIEHRVDGWLIPPDAPVSTWAKEIDFLLNRQDLAGMTEAARSRVSAANMRFGDDVLELVNGFRP